MPSKYIGSGLGEFKDELNGQWIVEGYFGRAGCYGYLTSDNKTTVKIVGMKRGIVPFDQFKPRRQSGRPEHLRCSSLTLIDEE
jgi:hypothetical protein